MTIVYGIPNCDTVKKARAWLAIRDIPHEFHDFKKHGVPAGKLPVWAHAVGWDKLLNRKGTTWRKLDAASLASAQTPEGAMALALLSPSVIKRPVVEWGAGALRAVARNSALIDVTVGFDELLWTQTVAT